MCTHIYIYIYVYILVYAYIYIERQWEGAKRERQRDMSDWLKNYTLDIYVCMYIYRERQSEREKSERERDMAEAQESAQEWTNRTLISHERTSVHFLVLPGSLLSFTEITEYTYISLI